MAFSPLVQISSQELTRISSTKLMPLGTMGFDRTGAAFRYGQAGAVNLAGGKLVQVPAVISAHQNVAVATAVVIGDRQVNVTLGATATTLDQYADGTLLLYDGSGQGQRAVIATNPVIALSTAGIFYVEDAFAAAVTTSGKVNLSLNPWAGALVSATSQTTEFATGVPSVAITAVYYGWFQTKGLAAVLGNGSITKGSGVVPGQTTAGSVDIEGTSTITQRVGQAYETGTSAKYNTVFLAID